MLDLFFTNVGDVTNQLGIPSWILIIVMIWSLAWKGFALWKSAKRSQPIWFVVLLLINTLGILEILYIFLFSEINLSGKKEGKAEQKVKSKKSSKKKR